MKTHEVVKCLEEDAENLAVLVGEMLATLTINIQRVTITSLELPGQTTTLARLMQQWCGRYQTLAESIGDCTRVTYYPKPKEEDRVITAE